jgi:hypothetical protein
VPQSAPGPFRKLDAITVLTGPLLPAHLLTPFYTGIRTPSSPSYRISMTPEPSRASGKSPGTQTHAFNQVVVPVLLGFSLATIVLVVTGPRPLPHASQVAVYFLTASTGLLLGSFQLSEDENWRRPQWVPGLRTTLTVLGSACLLVALGALIYTVIDHWWLVPVLACPALIPLLMKKRL